jgi:hypothetical protein
MQRLKKQKDGETFTEMKANSGELNQLKTKTSLAYTHGTFA